MQIGDKVKDPSRPTYGVGEITKIYKILNGTVKYNVYYPDQEQDVAGYYAKELELVPFQPTQVVENKELTRFKVGDKVKYLYDPEYGTIEITEVIVHKDKKGKEHIWYRGLDLNDSTYGLFKGSEIQPLQPEQTKELNLTQMVENLKDVTKQYQKKRKVLQTQESLLSEITYDLEEALRYLENASENIKDYLKEE